MEERSEAVGDFTLRTGSHGARVCAGNMTRQHTSIVVLLQATQILQLSPSVRRLADWKFARLRLFKVWWNGRYLNVKIAGRFGCE